jgi:hypothetical protein
MELLQNPTVQKTRPPTFANYLPEDLEGVFAGNQFTLISPKPKRPRWEIVMGGEDTVQFLSGLVIWLELLNVKFISTKWQK